MLKKILITIILAACSVPSSFGAVKNILFGSYWSPNSHHQNGLYLLKNTTENHWISVYKVANFPINIGSDELSFSESTCTGTYCIRVGQYNSSNGWHPILMTSHDSGEHWSQEKMIRGANGNLAYWEGGFYKINCKENSCLVTGNTVDKTGRHSQWIPALWSNDYGQSWQVANVAAEQKPNVANTMLHPVCMQTNCVATLINGGEAQFLHSNDNGKTWTLSQFT